MASHCVTKRQCTIKPEGTDQRNTYARDYRSGSIREKTRHQPNALEDVPEHPNDLECEYILSAVVSDFEDGLLPDIILRVRLIPLPLGNRIRIDIDNGPGLANFERGH